MNAAIYCRVSTEDQAEGHSLASQERLCRERAERDGFAIAPEHVYEDRLSGAKADRPKYQAMLAAAAAKEIEAVYVWKMDRLGRDLIERRRAEGALGTARVRLVSITEGEMAPDDPMAPVRAGVAEMERLLIAQRTRAGIESAARSGRYLGSRRPYGYRFEGKQRERRLVIDAQEEAVILRMVESYEAGAGDREIADRLNQEGIPAPLGGAWDKSSVANVLRSPIIAGFVHRKREVFEGLHDPIIELERLEQLREIRGTRRGKGRRPTGGHVFTGGVLRCPECRSALRPRTTPKGYAFYECTGRPCVQSSINARVVEGLILDSLLSLAFDPEETRARIEDAAGRERDRAEKMIARADRSLREIERKRERAQADYLDGALSAALYEAAAARLDEEAAQAMAYAAELQEAAEAAESEASDLDAEQEVIARLERLQEVVRGDGDTDSIEVVRQAIASTFHRVYLAEGEKPGSLVVIPQLRRETVAATRDRHVVALGVDHGQAQEPKRQALPEALTRGTQGR